MSIEEEVEHLVYAQCAQFIEVVNCDANGGIHIMIYYIRYRYIDETNKNLQKLEDAVMGGRFRAAIMSTRSIGDIRAIRGNMAIKTNMHCTKLKTLLAR